MRNRITDTFLSAGLAAILLGCFQALRLWAAPVTLPHTFTAGQSLPAAWLNDNFGALATSVNSIDTNQIQDGQVLTQDIAASAVTTVKLGDAPNGVTTGKISDLGVTTPKLAIGATLNALVTAGFTASLLITQSTAETAYVTLPSLTTRGGRVVLAGTASWTWASSAAPSTVYTVRLRRHASTCLSGTIVAQWALLAQATGNSSEVPTPFYVDAPTAGTYVYCLTVQGDGFGTTSFATRSANAGTYFAMELS